MKRGIAVFAAFAMLLPLCSTAGCSNGKEPPCRVEAEAGVIQPAFGETTAKICRSNSRSEYFTSEGKYVGNLKNGNSITWHFSAEYACSAELFLSLANADSNAGAFEAVSLFSLSLNGSPLAAPIFTVEAGTKYDDFWQTVSLSAVRLKQGVNYVTYTVLDETHPLNLDYFEVRGQRGRVEKHVHDWKVGSEPASCDAEGKSYKSCEDCGFRYYSDLIPALGHDYDNYHYDGETGKMVSRCLRCGEKRFGKTPSQYFGEVFNSEEEIQVRPEQVVYEAEDAYVCLAAGLSNPNADGCIEIDSDGSHSASGGRSVGNISRVGNYIRFTLESRLSCKADLVFRMANVLYTQEGIGELSPMSDYVYCLINGEEVDFSFVSFPGFSTHSYYEWRYVAVKNVDLKVGTNTLEIGAEKNEKAVTMPNCDVLHIYTEEACVRAVKTYSVNDVSVGEYDGSGSVKTALELVDDGARFLAGKSHEKVDLVLRLRAERALPDLSEIATAFWNGDSVNLEGIALNAGDNTLTLYGVPVKILESLLTFTAEGVELISAEYRSDEPVMSAPVASVDAKYDYLTNQNPGFAPALIYEAEHAEFGDSVSSREGVELVEINIYENSGKAASGNSDVGNFAVKGNAMTWRFSSNSDELSDFTLMLASANFSEEAGGNVATLVLSRYVRISVNGVYLNLEAVDLPVEALSDFYNWCAVTVKGLPLVVGENVVRLEVISNIAPNMDVLYVYSGANLSALPPVE